MEIIGGICRIGLVRCLVVMWRVCSSVILVMLWRVVISFDALRVVVLVFSIILFM